MKKFTAGVLFAASTLTSFVHASQFSDWQPRISAQRANVSLTELASRVSDGGRYTLNVESLSELLLSAQYDSVITLPLPNGTLVDYVLTPSDVFPQALQIKYPDIKTFSGYELGNPDSWGRFEVTPSGFHGMLTHGGEVIFIDPEYRGNQTEYVSYHRSDALPLSNIAQQDRRAPVEIPDNLNRFEANVASAAAGDTVIQRTYRIAVSAAGEYTQFHGGTKAKGLAAVTTMINRVDGIYMSELGIHLTLVPRNDELIFTNASSDPFSNNSGDIDRNPDVINSRIGENAYDIGHVVTTGSGGLAYLQGVCSSYYKARGTTGSSYPVNDSFHVDYVAHEIGHQFGGNHTFNGYAGSCNGNRSSDSAYEPGSGSTIMGYAGICSGMNTQNNSDPFFHSHSLDEINSFVESGGGRNCAQISTTSNSMPDVNAGSDYTIPANTPFELTGAATDSDGDALTYDWQQFDLGPRENSASDIRDDGERTIFRAWKPTTSPTRVFPRMEDVLDGSTVMGESYPTTNRNMTFRLIVRDGKGGTIRDTANITVKNTGAAFAVIYPKGGETVEAGNREITWNAAGTASSPISCAKVDIALSDNNGVSFNNVLATGVANDGAETVSIPNVAVPSARIKINCSDNVFFAVSQSKFIIKTGGDTCTTPAAPSRPTASNIAETSYSIAWTEVSQAEKYLVQRWNEPGNSWDDYKNTAETRLDITGETGEIAYSRVIAINSCGTEGAASDYVTVTLDTGGTCTAPKAPEKPVASNIGETSYDISWAAIADIETYQVQRWSESGSAWEDYKKTTATTLSITGETGTVAYARVIAIAKCGTVGEASESVKVTLDSGGGGTGDTYKGTLTKSGRSKIEPNGTYFKYDGGSLGAVLSGPVDADFDLYLYKWRNRNWVRVAVSESSSSDETITIEASAGYYYYRIYSYKGSGDYALTITK